MKKRVIIIAIVILSIILAVLLTKIVLKPEDQSATSKNENVVTENEEGYILFGYNETIVPDVMGYVANNWYYKITNDGDLYYCYSIYGGKILKESDSEKAIDGNREEFIKKLDEDTIETIKKYIYEKMTNSSVYGEYYVAIMEENEWNRIYIEDISYLKNLIDE